MSETLQSLSGLGEIAGRYDALLCDVWGVVHNGRAANCDAINTLARFRETGGTVLMLTNAPRPSTQIPAQFEALGVPRECWDAIITSGDATKALLAHHAPGPAFKLGPPKDDLLYQGTGMKFAALDEARLISCTGLFDDRSETPEDYAELLESAASLNLPMICANPDRVVHYGDRLIYCGGALAQDYAARGGTVMFGGKPHEAIYELCFSHLQNLRGQRMAAARILAIGDGLATDVAGAAAQGVDCLFIAGGIHGAQIVADDFAKSTSTLLYEHGTKARYAMPALRW